MVDYLQKSGVRFGADLNAYTNFDETVCQRPIPSDKPELVQGGLQIMRDWAQDANTRCCGDAEREVFELSRMQELWYYEITMQLNISEQTVKNQVSSFLKISRVI